MHVMLRKLCKFHYVLSVCQQNITETKQNHAGMFRSHQPSRKEREPSWIGPCFYGRDPRWEGSPQQCGRSRRRGTWGVKCIERPTGTQNGQGLSHSTDILNRCSLLPLKEAKGQRKYMLSNRINTKSRLSPVCHMLTNKNCDKLWQYTENIRLCFN